MRSVSACPDGRVLQRFLLGLNTAEEAEALEQHLERCDRCSSALQALQGEDSIVEAIRSQSGAGEEAGSEVVRRLTERLKGLRPGGDARMEAFAHGEASSAPPLHPGGPSVEAIWVQTGPPAPGASTEATEAIYDFLAPALGPNELGRLGHYQVRTVLGAGGMGVVFQAYDPQLERLVALKAMLPALAARPSAKQRFLREAKAGAAIKHDHIVTIYHVGEDRGAPFLAMELLEGESLDQGLQREARLPLADVLRIAREIAAALGAAHEKGLIHRDVKPANVWLEGKRVRVKVLDFGLARSTADSARLTQAGTIVGTPAFMAPEQLRGDVVGARCDLFSLGCVLYRLATGEVPFKGTDTISTVVAVATESPRPPRELNPDLPPAVCDLVMRLLAKNADERPPSALAVVEAIQALEQRQGPAAAKRRPSRRRRLALAAAVLLALLGLAGYLFGPAIVRPRSGEGEPVGKGEGPRAPPVADKPGAKAVSWASPGPKHLFSGPAHALNDVLDFRDVAGASSKELRAWRARLGSGLRLSSVTTRRGTGTTRFNAVAIREKALRLVRFYPELNRDEAARAYDRLRADDFRPLALCWSLPADENVSLGSSQLWARDGVGFQTWYGALDKIVGDVARSKAEGYRLTDLDALLSREGPLYNAILASDQGRQWDALYALSAEELLSTVEHYQRKGWRPDVLSPHWNGDRFRFALVVEAPDRVDWRFRMEMSLEDYQKESAAQKRQGLFPLTIASHGDEADVRYAAIWVRYRIPQGPE